MALCPQCSGRGRTCIDSLCDGWCLHCEACMFCGGDGFHPDYDEDDEMDARLDREREEGW